MELNNFIKKIKDEFALLKKEIEELKIRIQEIEKKMNVEEDDDIW